MIDDIYINLDCISGRAFNQAGISDADELKAIVANSIFYPTIQNEQDKLRIVAAIIEASTQHELVEFSVDVKREGLFRCRILKTAKGSVIAARKHSKQLPDIQKLSLAPGILKWLLSPGLCKGGLVAIVGMPGSGKTTTCAASVVARLSAHGGVCITIEDPIEYDMQGQHDEGVCWQIPVTNDKEYHEAMKGALRGYPAGVPTILMMGEVRDPVAAASVLNASIDGRLVFITLHASDTKSALGRLKSMASESLGIAQADYLIAESLQGVLHQKLEKGIMTADLLVATDIVRATIRTGRYEHLVSEMDRQRVLLGLNQVIQ